jgi:hypothetical protein
LPPSECTTVPPVPELPPGFSVVDPEQETVPQTSKSPNATLAMPAA